MQYYLVFLTASMGIVTTKLLLVKTVEDNTKHDEGVDPVNPEEEGAMSSVSGDITTDNKQLQRYCHNMENMTDNNHETQNFTTALCRFPGKSRKKEQDYSASASQDQDYRLVLLVMNGGFKKTIGIIRNQQIMKIPYLGKQFTISFVLLLQPTQPTGWWKSILHFTTGGNCCNPGSRIPGIFIKDYLLMIQLDHIEYQSTTIIKHNRLVAIKLNQIPVNGKYVFTIGVDTDVKGDPNRHHVPFQYHDYKVVFSRVNSKPQIFKDVNAYAGDPWHHRANGYISNLQYNTE